MIDEPKDDGDSKDSVPPHRVPPPMDRASESVVNPVDPAGRSRDAPLMKQTTAIESGEIEISPASFAAPSSASPSSSGATSLPPASLDPPPSTIIANAMGRGKQRLSLGAIVGIGGAIFLLVVGLALLLFR
jgi:hypothetical protein